MKKCFILLFIILLSGCSDIKAPLEIEPTIENFVKYIVEDYQYGASGEFIDRYLDNTYLTNQFLINLLRDSFTDISIVSTDDDGAVLLCDDMLLRIDLALGNGKISKIRLLGVQND